MRLTRQSRIDYRMARRATLRDVRTGLRGLDEVCDAHPDLVRAGKHLSDPADGSCPICGEDEPLRHVTYVFHGRGPKSASRRGRAVRRDRIVAEAKRYGALNVYTVEICIDCRWHHLLEAYWLGSRKAAETG